MFVGGLLFMIHIHIIHKSWKQLMFINSWIDKMWYVRTMEHYSALWILTHREHCVCVCSVGLTLCDPMYWSPPDSSVRGITQARILEWVAISFSRGSFRPRDQTHDYCLAGRLFTTEPLKRMLLLLSCIWLFATPGTAALQAPDHTVKFQTV